MGVALIALFVALGGSAYSALSLPANSVGTRQLKKDAVISSRVKNGSLMLRDFKRGQVPAGPTGPAGAVGPVGPSGPVGAVGPRGPAGTAKAYGLVQVNASSGNAEWQPGSNHGFPANPIRKAQGSYCIPMPSGVDADTATVLLTPGGPPSLDVAVTGSSCANTRDWIGVEVYGPLTLTGYNPPAFALGWGLQDRPFQVAVM
jgi:hypothetical protein